MRRKLLENDQLEIIRGKVIIAENNNKLFFEIENEVTYDIAEAVAILLKYNINDESIWNINITEDYKKDICPEKSLFWLTGGKYEWVLLDNYKKPWHICYKEFQEEFGSIINDVVKSSKKLIDIKHFFERKLNIATFYNFALSKNLL